jgi:hypothetical protein
MRYLRIFFLGAAITTSSTSCSYFGGIGPHSRPGASEQRLVVVDGRIFRWERRVISSEPFETTMMLTEVGKVPSWQRSIHEQGVEVSPPKTVASLAEPVSNVSGAQ